MPYAWQFEDEDMWMPASQDQGSTASGSSPETTPAFETTTQSIDSHFISEQLDHLSLRISKQTVVVLDNAKPHTAKAVQERRPIWSGG